MQNLLRTWFSRRETSEEHPLSPEEIRDQERLRLSHIWKKYTWGIGEQSDPWEVFTPAELEQAVEFLAERTLLAIPLDNWAALCTLVENTQLSRASLQLIHATAPETLNDSSARYHFVIQENVPPLAWMAQVRRSYFTTEPQCALPGRPVLSQEARTVLQILCGAWVGGSHEDILQLWEKTWALPESHREIFLTLLRTMDGEKHWQNPRPVIDELLQTACLV